MDAFKYTFDPNAARPPFALPPRPVHRDDLISALHEGRVMPWSDDDAGRVDAVTVSMAEWFDFGTALFDANDRRDLGADATAFWQADLVRLPYPRCVFRVRFVSADASLPPGELLFVCEETESRSIEIEALDVQWPGYLVFDPLARITASGREVRGHDGRPQDLTFAMFKVFNWLWLALNTRNITKRIAEPAARLNRARVKAGKQPLERVTYVDAGQYVTALRETRRLEQAGAGDGRRSPRMHLRRAHLRHLADGKIIPVSAAIINAAIGVGAQRDSYLVCAT